MWQRQRTALIFLSLAAGLSACSTTPDEGEGVLTVCLPRGDAWVPVSAELAVTPGQREQGLQGREELPRRAGMLFLYDSTQSASRGFWMYRTQIPLEIAWLDREGVVQRTVSMRPCSAEKSSECPVYEARVPHDAALEVNDGLFEQLDIGEGAQLRLGQVTADNGAACAETRPFSEAFTR